MYPWGPAFALEKVVALQKLPFWYGAGDNQPQKMPANVYRRCAGPKKGPHHRGAAGKTTQEYCTVLPEVRRAKRK